MYLEALDSITDRDMKFWYKRCKGEFDMHIFKIQIDSLLPHKSKKKYYHFDTISQCAIQRRDMDHQRRHTTNIPTRRHANAILHDLFSNLRQDDDPHHKNEWLPNYYFVRCALYVHSRFLSG